MCHVAYLFTHAQAEDRIYRLNSPHKAIYVYRMAVEGTVEAVRMQQKKDEKQKLIDAYCSMKIAENSFCRSRGRRADYSAITGHDVCSSRCAVQCTVVEVAARSTVHIA